MRFERYGLAWDGTDDLSIEMYMIQHGGKWKQGSADIGLGNQHHYEQMRRIIWPELDGDHNGQRWHTLCKNEILNNRVTVLMGCGSSGKTHEASWIYLCEYFCFPEETCVLVSSTDVRGLKKRVWGEVVSLWERAVDRFDFLPGHLLDSAIAITTDSLEDVELGERKARDMRKGVFGIPCVVGGKMVGLSKFIGIKQKRMRLVADEASAMNESFLSSFSNLNKNEDFRAIILGNPNDPLDPLGKAAEPVDGWTSHMEPDKTSVWKTRFMNGTCVNLVGTDSPNFDFPETEPTRFKYLISKEKIADTLSFFAKDSVEYYSQCVGVMKVGLLSRRVITRELCTKFGAMDGVVWSGDEIKKICSLDAAYGGDRCVCGHIEFGKDIAGNVIISIKPQHIIPINVKSGLIPEDQIAHWVMDYCQTHDIPPENFFHDSTGRGTLGTSLARIWSTKCNPVEFGGSPTNRPVANDLFITDEKTKVNRLKLCSEHYTRFVCELWYSVRYAIESGQIRNLSEDVMEEGCMRNWDYTKNGKIDLETKIKMKERTGRSPDLFDCLAIAVEGARRKGFTIQRVGAAVDPQKNNRWLLDLKKKRDQMFKAKSLTRS